MILLEVLRQLEIYQSFKRIRQKEAITFPFFIGNMEESYPTAQAAESARLEMQWYPFTFYRSRVNYDPHSNIGSVNGERFRHKVDIEDFWVNAANKFDIKKRLFSKLPVSLIKTTEPFLAPDQLEDNAEYTQPNFDEHAPLPPIKWLEPKHADLTTLMRPVMKYSRWWVDQQCHRLRQRDIILTYDLMGEAERYSSNEEATQSARPIESTKKKGKAVVNEGPSQKKQWLEPSPYAASANINDILAIDKSLAEREIHSPVREENVESIHQEDEQPPSPNGTEVLESNNEMDVEEGEFQKGMISALRVMMCEKGNQEVEGIEQPTVPDWLKERLEVKTQEKEVQEEDHMEDFLARLEQVATKKPTKRFSTI